MSRVGRLGALAGAAATVGAGLVAQRAALNRRRRNDPEGGEDFGSRRGIRPRHVDLPDGARVFVEETGPESPAGAIFVHGSALRTDVWHYQLPGLGDHRLVFCDLRGHGQSGPRGKEAYSAATLIRDLDMVVDAVGLQETVIVGHSVGGMIALELCRRHPEYLGTKIKGLVLVNTTYGPVTESLIGGGVGLTRLERILRNPIDYIGTKHEHIERLRGFVRPSDAAFWAVAMMGFGPHSSARQIDFTFDMISETPMEVIFDLLKSYRDFDVTEHLGDITVPAVVIGGTHDRLTVARASEYLGENLPKADLHIFERCGHMAMLERHREFNRIVTAFLDDVLGRPAERSSRR